MLAAVRARSVRERARLVWTGGWSVVQVFERLDARGQAQFGSSDDVVDRRRAVETVRARLLALVESGALLRKTAVYSAELKSKGPRDVVVDLFRSA